jgi:gas vesicle protein
MRILDDGRNTMTHNDANESQESTCGSFSNGFGQKMMFFLIGGGIGAAVALLFAPKSGVELRGDIADAAAKSYDESIEAANRLKTQTSEYYRSAREKGGEILDIVSARAATVKEELGSDAEKIVEIVESPVKATLDARKPLIVS